MKLISKAAIVALTSLLITCAPTAPDMKGVDSAITVAEDVVTTNLMPWIEQLAYVRAQDIRVNSEGYEAKELYPANELTRDASVKLVQEAFITMGYTPTTVVLGEGPQAAYNVAAEWRGSTRPQEVVLVAGHLDAFYAGADDNASAVAAMLEIARAVRKHRFARTLRFVAFDLEEFGSVGSTRYIQAGYADDIVAAVVMDLIGYASTEPNSQDDVLGLRLPDVGDFILLIGNANSSEWTQKVTALNHAYGLTKLISVIAPGDGAYFLSSVFMRSDHGVLWYKGIPALFFTDTANFRNPHYHLPTDTPETLDPEFLARNVKAIAAAAALYAEVLP
ncbi:MAG: M28 family peptidase [Calditrichaeota bacterium]|nr:MAG: M28 family peptidase [Calditrichota bacterium]